MTMDFMICAAPLDSSFQKERLQLVNKGSLGRRRKPSRSYLKLHLSPTDTSLQGSPLFDQRSLSAVLPVCNGVRKVQTSTSENTPRCQSPLRSRSQREVGLPRTITTSTPKPSPSTPILKNNSDATCGVKRKLSDAGRSAVLIQTWERRTRFDAELKKQQQQKQQQQQQKQQQPTIRNRFEDKENKPTVAMPDSCIRRKYRGNLEFDDGDGKHNGGRYGVVRDNTSNETKKLKNQNECNGLGDSKYGRPIYKEKSRKKTQEVPEWVSLSRKLCAKFVEDHLDNEETCQEPAPPFKKESVETKTEKLVEKSVVKQHNVTIVKQQHTREVHQVSQKLPRPQTNTVIAPKSKKSVDSSEVKQPEEPPWIHLSRKLCTKFIEQHIEYPKPTELSQPENRPDIAPNGNVRIIEKIGNKTGTRKSQTKKPEPEWISLSRKLRAKFIESHIDDPDTISLENQLNVSDPEETSSESLLDTPQGGTFGTVTTITKASKRTSQRNSEDRYHAEVETISPVPRQRPKEDICWEFIETDFPTHNDHSQTTVTTCSSNENKLQQSSTNCRFNSGSEQIGTHNRSTNYSSNGCSFDAEFNSMYSTPLCKNTIICNGIDPTRNQPTYIEEVDYDRNNKQNEISPINNFSKSFKDNSEYHQNLTGRISQDQTQLDKNHCNRLYRDKSNVNGHAQSVNPCFNESKYSRNFSVSEIHNNDVLFAPLDYEIAESESKNEIDDGKIFVEFHSGLEMKRKEDSTYKYFVAENKIPHDKKQPIDGSYFNLSTWEEAHYHSDSSDPGHICNSENTSNNLQKNTLSKSMNTIFDFKEKNVISERIQNVNNNQWLQQDVFENRKPHYESENSLCKTNVKNDSSGSDYVQNSQQTSRLSKVTLKCNTSFNRSRHQILEVNNSPKKKQRNIDECLNVPQNISAEIDSETKADKIRNLSESSKRDSCKKNEIDNQVSQNSTETIIKCLDFSDEYSEPIDSRPMLLKKRSYISRSDEALYKRECVSLKSQVPFHESSINQNCEMYPSKQDNRSKSTYSVKENDIMATSVVPVSISPKKEPSPRETRFKQSILRENEIIENNIVSDFISSKKEPSPREKRCVESVFRENEMTVNNVTSNVIYSNTESLTREKCLRQENAIVENNVVPDSVCSKRELSPKDMHFKQTINGPNFTTPEKIETDLACSSDCRPTLNKIISHKSNSVDCFQETQQQNSFDDESFNDSKTNKPYYSQIEPMVVISQSNGPKTNFKTLEYQSEIPLSAKLVSKQNGSDTNTCSSSSVSIRNESPYFETQNSAPYEDLFKETTSCPSDSETSSWTVMKKNTYYVNGRSSSMNDLDFSDCSLSVKCDYASSSNQSTIQSCASSSFYVNLRDYDSHMLEPGRKKDISKTHSNVNVHKLSASNPPTPETLRNLFTSPLKNMHPPQNGVPSKIITRMPPEANQHHYYSVEPSSSSVYKHIFDPKPSKAKKSERSSSIKIKDIAHGIILTFRRFQNHSKSHVSPSHYVDVSHLAQSGNTKSSNGFDSDKGKKKNSHSKNRRSLSVENVMKTDSDSGCATTSESYGLKHPKFGNDVIASRFRNELAHQEIHQTRNLCFNDKKKVKNGKKSGDKSKKNKGKSFEPRTIPTVSRKVQQMADGTLYLVTTVSGDSTMPGVYSDSPDTSSELSLSRPVKLNGESNC